MTVICDDVVSTPHDALGTYIRLGGLRFGMIPEPTTLLLGVLGVSALAVRRRRRVI